MEGAFEHIDQRIANVCNHGQYILGPEVEELEYKLASFVSAQHCVAVSSGTDALLISLLALDIKPGDEVITTPFSFIATAETIALIGLYLFMLISIPILIILIPYFLRLQSPRVLRLLSQ